MNMHLTCIDLSHHIVPNQVYECEIYIWVDQVGGILL